MKIKPWLKILVLVAFAATAVFAMRKCSRSEDNYDKAVSLLDKLDKDFAGYKEASEASLLGARQQVGTLETLLSSERLKTAQLSRELRSRKVETLYLPGREIFTLKRDTFTEYVTSTPEMPASPLPFLYDDEWMSFQAFVDGDEVVVLYSITDSLYIQEGVAMNSNPNITIREQKPLPVVEKMKKKCFLARWFNK